MGIGPLEPMLPSFIYKSENLQRWKWIFGFLGFGSMTTASYWYLTSKNLEECAFVRQSMINLRLNDRVRELIGSPIELQHFSLGGDVRTYSGVADVTFQISGPQGTI